jgi:hypothetical protein
MNNMFANKIASLGDHNTTLFLELNNSAVVDDE